MKPFAVFDIDGTLIRWQLYHSLADTLAKRGYIDEDIYRSMKSARMVWKQRGKDTAFSKYEKQVIRAVDYATKNISPAQLEECVDMVFDEYKDQVYTYTRDLITELKAKGYVLLAVSGSPQEIVGRIAEHYGFDGSKGSTYYRKGERFTGAKRVVAYNKAGVLKDLVVAHGASIKGSVGVGDTGSDIPMLELVETPIAFNPEKKLYDHAVGHGWQIVVERKNVVYRLEPRNGRYILA